MTSSPWLELSGPQGRVLTYCSGREMYSSIRYLPLSESPLSPSPEDELLPLSFPSSQ